MPRNSKQPYAIQSRIEQGCGISYSACRLHDNRTQAAKQKLNPMRPALAQQSHQMFAALKTKNSFRFFIIKIHSLRLKYYTLNKQLTKQSLLIGYQVLHYSVRKFKK